MNNLLLTEKIFPQYFKGSHYPGVGNMDGQTEAMLRQYAWAYFSFHADQRMKTFNFFIVAAGLLSGGIITLLKNGSSSRHIIPMGILLIILSVVFLLLDRRNRALVRNGEAAIKYLDGERHFPQDKSGGPHVLCIFARDDFLTEMQTGRFSTSRYCGYSRLLGGVFVLFAVLGLFFVLSSLG